MVTDRLTKVCPHCDVACLNPCTRDRVPHCVYYRLRGDAKPVSQDDTTDPVNHPSHYNAGKVETIEYIEQVTASYPGAEAALVGNVIKYVSRAPLKGKKLEDLKKAQWYLSRLIENLSK